MKRKPLIKQCIPALLALAALAGCGNPSSSTPSTELVITGAPSGAYYSLSVFAENATISNDTNGLTKLGGYLAQGIGAGNSTSFTIKVSPEISAGNYVLVLGVSNDMSTGKMYITGTDSPKARKAIAVTPGGTIAYNTTDFTSTPYEASVIASDFGTPSP
ncbi:MAG: hypothetical protein LBE02_04350 [Spirochaetaceae bacterium]|jgi:hypothetical protein|nr:hypothetical protein [Spirochaetaceae bacterium]